MALQADVIAAVRKKVDRLVNNADSTSTPLLSMFSPEQVESDTSFRWPLKYGDNLSSTTFSEGDALSAAGKALTATAAQTLADNMIRTVYSITGHAQASTRNGYFDAWLEETNSAFEAHQRKAEDLAVAQLEAQIDSSGSIYGLLRSTYKMASYEAAVATLALSDLNTMWETLAKDPIEADMTNMVIMSTIDMLSEYLDVANGVQYNEISSDQLAGVIDAGKYGKVPFFSGRPWLTVSTMTATTILMLDPRQVRRLIYRPLEVQEMGKVDDSDTIALVSCESLIHQQPRYAGKLT
jgi:hypothetical protein